MTNSYTKRPMTLVEVLLASVILAIVVLGSTMMFITGWSTIQRASVKRAVIERLIEVTENQVQHPVKHLPAPVPDQLTVQGKTVDVNVTIEKPTNFDTYGEIKKATLEANWSIRGKEQSTRIVTYLSAAGAGR